MGGRTAAGFPIRTSPGQRLLSTSPELFAASRVLHRLCAPRHSPSALSSLTTHNRSRLGVDISVNPCLISPTYSYTHNSCQWRPQSSASADLQEQTRRSKLKSFRRLPFVFTFQRTAELNAIVRLELIGIEPTTSGLQSPRSPN
jgi:hypothetical protein